LDDTDPLHRDECSVCGEFGRDGELWYRCVSVSGLTQDAVAGTHQSM
jgi:hypothetical protein